MQITAELCWGGSQNVSIWTPLVLICAGQMPAPNGGYARGCRRMVDHALRSAFEPEARTMLPEPKRRTAW